METWEKMKQRRKKLAALIGREMSLTLVFWLLILFVILIIKLYEYIKS